MVAAGRGAGGRARAALVAASLLASCPAGRVGVRAQDAELPALALVLPPDLHVGEHARVVLSVHLPATAARPLLVTPFHEGAALEIVKGRLLRSDARDPSANPLRFELPVLALAPGAAVMGARLLAYVCEARAPARAGCRAVEVETRASVVVLPR